MEEAAPQRVKHARNGDKGGGVFAFDGAENFRGLRGIFEDDRGADERRHEERHELAEDMAQRNDGDKAQRMKPARGNCRESAQRPAARWLCRR